MKICPVCNTQYEDDASEKCTNDDTALVPVPKLDENPPLPTIVPAEPDADTSDFDLEAVHGEIEKRKAEPEAMPGVTTPEAPPEVVAPEAAPPVPVVKAKNKLLLLIAIAIITLFIVVGGIGTYCWMRGNMEVSIELHSNPDGATIYFDGKLIGIAPATLRTTKGAHRVVFEHAGYQTIEEFIEVSGDGHVVVKKTVPVQ